MIERYIGEESIEFCSEYMSKENLDLKSCKHICI